MSIPQNSLDQSTVDERVMPGIIRPPGEKMATVAEEEQTEVARLAKRVDQLESELRALRQAFDASRTGRLGVLRLESTEPMPTGKK